MNRVFRTLYVRLSIVLFALLVVVGVAWVAIASRTTELYVQEVRQRLHRELAAHLIDEGLLLRGKEVDPAALDHVIHMLMVVNPAIEVYVLDEAGKILAYSTPPGEILRNNVSLEPIRKFLAGDPELPLLGDDPRHAGGRKVFSAAALGDPSRPDGFVYVVLGGTLYDSVAQQLRGSLVLRQAALVGAGVLLIVLVCGVLLFRRMTRRLRRLTESVAAFRSSELDPAESRGGAVTPTRGDEIDQLEVTFERMERRIGSQLEQLSRVDSVRRELIANVSHDLRTPLASLQGYLETLVLKGDDISSEQRQHYIEIAARHSANLGRRVGDLFELARLDAEAVKATLEPFSLPELVQDVVQEFHIAAEKKGVRLSTKGLRDLPFLRADIRLMQRALENLISNAVNHTPRDGEVCVTVAR
ncbi:MAG: HAMP domain-containing protein, partial [Acidobacteriota bacterium]|nr:HAMP domain-containing protein [Acidobacteriota bacterium]